PRVADPHVLALERLEQLVGLVPEELHEALRRDEEVLHLSELVIRHLPRVRDALIEPGDHEHLERVDPRELAAIPGVEQQRPGVLLWCHLVGPVQGRDEPPVLHDEVLLAVELTELLELGVEVGEVRDQRRVPRLHGAEIDVVAEPIGAGVDDVVVRPGCHLGEPGVVVLEQDELRGVARLVGVLLPQEQALLAGVVVAVPVARPIEDLQVAGLLLERRVGCARLLRCGVRRLLAGGERGADADAHPGVAQEVATTHLLRERTTDLVRHVAPPSAVPSSGRPYHPPMSQAEQHGGLLPKVIATLWLTTVACTSLTGHTSAEPGPGGAISTPSLSVQLPEQHLDGMHTTESTLPDAVAASIEATH